MAYFTNLRSKFYYWHLLVALIIARYIFLTILDFSQYLYISQGDVPANLRGYLTVEQWDILRNSGYYAFKWEFLDNFVLSSFNLIVVGFNLLPKSWDLLTSFTNAYLAGFIAPENAWGRSLLCYAVFRLIKTVITVAPHLISHDPNARILVNDLVMPPTSFIGVLSYIAIVRWMSRGYKWLKVGSIVVVMAVLLLLLASFGGALFPRKGPGFPDGPLKDQILSLLAKAGFNRANLLYVPGLLNAATVGVGQSAIIMVGGLLLELYAGHDDQVLAVIGHELGHWNYFHAIIKALILAATIGLFIAIYTALVSRPRFYEAFDMQTSDFIKSKAVPFGIGLILIEIIAEQLHIFITPVVNYFSWMKEFASDAYSVKLGMGSAMYEALYKLCILHPLSIGNFAYALFHGTHPSLAIRLGALKKLI